MSLCDLGWVARNLGSGQRATASPAPHGWNTSESDTDAVIPCSDTHSAASSVPFFQVVVPDPLAFPIENVVAVARIFFRIQLKFNSIWLVHLPHA